jgi:hypothetical protein
MEGRDDDGLTLSGPARILLWDYPRGSLPYDVVVLLLALLFFLVPAGFWRDPMVTAPAVTGEWLPWE